MNVGSISYCYELINKLIKIMSLDFILIPFCIFIILFLLNRENRISKRNQKAR